jgi:hypothetical protein
MKKGMLYQTKKQPSKLLYTIINNILYCTDRFSFKQSWFNSNLNDSRESIKLYLNLYTNIFVEEDDELIGDEHV